MLLKWWGRQGGLGFGQNSSSLFLVFFILFFLVHCLIHAYDCHADGWGIYFLTTFLLGDSGLTSVSKRRGSPFFEVFVFNKALTNSIDRRNNFIGIF